MKKLYTLVLLIVTTVTMASPDSGPGGTVPLPERLFRVELDKADEQLEIEVGTANGFLRTTNPMHFWADGMPDGIIRIGNFGVNFLGKYTFPLDDGTIGQALTTDGAGNVDWAIPSGSETISHDGVGNSAFAVCGTLMRCRFFNGWTLDCSQLEATEDTRIRFVKNNVSVSYLNLTGTGGFLSQNTQSADDHIEGTAAKTNSTDGRMCIIDIYRTGTYVHMSVTAKGQH